MLFVPPYHVDTVWEMIAGALEAGKLGCSAKVAPCAGPRSDSSYGNDVLVCIYVSDFTDCTDVRRVLLGIKELGLVVKNAFKADALSTAGLGIATLRPLRLADSWQLHLDILREVYPMDGDMKAKKRGFDLAALG
jgi:hypothetical protein